MIIDDKHGMIIISNDIQSTMTVTKKGFWHILKQEKVVIDSNEINLYSNEQHLFVLNMNKGLNSISKIYKIDGCVCLFLQLRKYLN